MASTVRVSLNVEIDNEPIRGFPVVRSISVDELLGAMRLEQASGGGSTALPGISEVATRQFLLFETDQAVTMRFGTGAAGDLTLAANSLVLVVNGNHTANVEVNNASGSTANLKYSVGGT